MAPSTHQTPDTLLSTNAPAADNQNVFNSTPTGKSSARGAKITSAKTHSFIVSCAIRLALSGVMPWSFSAVLPTTPGFLKMTGGKINKDTRHHRPQELYGQIDEWTTGCEDDGAAEWGENPPRSERGVRERSLAATQAVSFSPWRPAPNIKADKMWAGRPASIASQERTIAADQRASHS